MATFTLTRISIIPRSLIHCRAKQTTKYVYPELNAIQLLFLVLLSTRHTTYSSFFHPLPSQTKKYFGHWVPKWLAYKRWRTDIRRWRTGRWRTDSLAKRPVTVLAPWLVLSGFRTEFHFRNNYLSLKRRHTERQNLVICICFLCVFREYKRNPVWILKKVLKKCS